MSGIATGTALAIGLGTSAAAGVAGSAISSSAAGNAANAQVSASEQAQQLQAQEAQNSLDFQKQVYSDTQANQAPWLAAGKEALGNLSSTYGNGGPTWNQTFTAPTAATEQNDPGYQFRLSQGEEAMTNSAAAQGIGLSGGTAKALGDYAQNYASNEYGNVYNRSFNQYLQNYNQFQQNNTNTYNREAGIAGVGQVAGQTLANEGQQAANTTANIDLTTGAQQGQDLNNIGAARGSGYVGSANAWNSGLGTATGALSNYAMLQAVLNNNTCWIAAELYNGWNDPRTQKVREWIMLRPALTAAYRKIGPQMAEAIRQNATLRLDMRKLFDRMLCCAYMEAS